MTTRCTCY